LKREDFCTSEVCGGFCVCVVFFFFFKLTGVLVSIFQIFTPLKSDYIDWAIVSEIMSKEEVAEGTIRN